LIGDRPAGGTQILPDGLRVAAEQPPDYT